MLFGIGVLVPDCTSTDTQRNVKGPILPTSMLKIIIHLPADDKCGVSPRDNPTVPMAESSSNKMTSRDAVSVTVSPNVHNAATAPIFSFKSISGLAVEGKLLPR